MIAFALAVCALSLQEPEQAPNTWVKRTPVEGTPVSPRLGYEGDCVWDSARKVLLRYGGHNQGGGGEQHSEIWTCEPLTGKWTLKEPNTSPPGVCCSQQNVYDPLQARFLRFPSFSGSHGWQWSREILLNNTSVWSYDLGTNLWRNLRPFPTASPAPLRCASWDTDHDVVVVFGGEGSREGTLVYDPHANTWTSMKPARQPEFRSGGSMAYDAARKLHILFGAQFTNDPNTWSYDLRKNEWRELKPGKSPPTDKNDAVLTFDSVNNVVLAIVKGTEGKDEGARSWLETWVYDARTNTWTRMNPEREPDPSGNRARVLRFVPEMNLAMLENCTSKPREQQVWTYRYAARKKPDVRASVSVEGDRLTLNAPPGKYTVLRGTGTRPWEATFAEIGVCEGGGTIVDTPGSAACYRFVSGTATVATARAQPRAVEDVIVSVTSAKEVEISWKSSTSETYHVERAVVEVATEDELKRLKSRTPPLEEPSVGAIKRVGPFTRVTPEALKGGTFVDTSVDLTRPGKIEGEPSYQKSVGDLDPDGKRYRFAVYAYRVRAVSALGIEGGASAGVFTIPSAPQWVFGKEEGSTAHVKWAANPEKGLKGYRVYRMDGRFDKEPVTRLTADPQSGLTFSDADAAKKSRRYYIVAVDALGQEGHPSSPAWYEREWKSFYKPFTGEWHQ